MSVKGNTAMDLSLTTFVASVFVWPDAVCFVGQNLSASSAVSTIATTASPTTSTIPLRRNLGCAACAVPIDVPGAPHAGDSRAACAGSRMGVVSLEHGAAVVLGLGLAPLRFPWED